MLEESIITKLESLRLRSIEIHEALAKEGATDDMVQFTQLNKEYSEITPIVDLFQSLQDAELSLTFSYALLHSFHVELLELATIYVTSTQDNITFLAHYLTFILFPNASPHPASLSLIHFFLFLLIILLLFLVF